MSLAASIVQTYSGFLGFSSPDFDISDRSMIGLIKSLDLKLSTTDDEDEITIVTGRCSNNLTGKTIIVVDANISKTQSISCDELYILGKSRVSVDVISSKVLVVWASSFKADYVSAKCGHIATDMLDIGKMKSGTKVYGPNTNNYNWREMSKAVKEMLESLRDNDDLSSNEDIEKFVAGNYGFNGLSRSVSVEETDDDDDKSMIKDKIEEGIAPFLDSIQNNEQAKKILLKSLAVIRHAECREILEKLFTDPQQYESAIEDMVELLSDEDERQAVEESMEAFMDLVKDEDFLKELIADAMKNAPQNESSKESINDGLLTKDEMTEVEALTNKELSDMIAIHIPDDVAGTEKQKSKAVLISEVKMLAHVDSSFRKVVRDYLTMAKSTSWDEAKTKSDTIHSEAIAAEAPENDSTQEAQA